MEPVRPLSWPRGLNVSRGSRERWRRKPGTSDVPHRSELTLCVAPIHPGGEVKTKALPPLSSCSLAPRCTAPRGGLIFGHVMWAGAAIDLRSFLVLLIILPRKKLWNNVTNVKVFKLFYIFLHILRRLLYLSTDC